MNKFSFLLTCFIFSGCSTGANSRIAEKTNLITDLEDYAIASCLALQKEAFLIGQGDAWASVVIQRTKVDTENLMLIYTEVQQLTQKKEMPVIRIETDNVDEKSLPIMYCKEIIDEPSIRSLILQIVHSYD
jgi:hypothetical protein